MCYIIGIGLEGRKVQDFVYYVIIWDILSSRKYWSLKFFISINDNGWELEEYEVLREDGKTV